MSKPTLAFIGAGNMAKSIIGGLIAEGYEPALITATGPRQESLDKLAGDFGIRVDTDNRAAAARADAPLSKRQFEEFQLVVHQVNLILRVNAASGTD